MQAGNPRTRRTSVVRKQHLEPLVVRTPESGIAAPFAMAVSSVAMTG